MKPKRLTCTILALLLLMPTVSGCSNSEEHEETSSASPPPENVSDTAETEEVTDSFRSSVKDNLPADLDFDGSRVNVVFRNEEHYSKWDMNGTENSGDVVWDAIWFRNLAVEERLGIEFNIQPTQSQGLSNVAAELKNMVFAGINDYDIISSTANTTVTQSMYPFLMELSDMKYLDITQPWWHEGAISEMALEEDRYRFLSGDITLNSYLKCGVMYYNKDIYTDHHGNADELYETVLSGDWTYDVLTELTGSTYIDKNGDGIANPGDTFGLMVPSGYTEASVHMIFGCDIDTYERIDGGDIDLSPFNNEHTVNAMDKIIKLLHNTDGVYVSDKSIDNSLSYFSENYSLFWSGRLTNAVTDVFREMESDYGILPMPKYDEAQKDYVTLIHDSTTVICVPKSVALDRIDMVGAVLEAWASEAYRQVITPFIESALKAKYSRDALSGQVIDLIFEKPVLNFLDMYSSNTGNLLDEAIIKNIAAGQNNFASTVASMLKRAQKVLNNYLKDIESSDG